MKMTTMQTAQTKKMRLQTHRNVRMMMMMLEINQRKLKLRAQIAMPRQVLKVTINK